MNSLYLYNALRGSKDHESNAQDFYYLTRLINFRNEYNFGKIGEENFSESLLQVLRNCPNFSKLSRVCVAIAYPLSNKIGVLSSATIHEENLMNNKYSCYVSKTSSLSSIEKGSVRVYGDIDKILEKYIDEGKPVQRSIYYLKKMGVKSGLTIKIEGNALNGYLFLNSDEVDYFKDVSKENSFYLNLLELITTEYFYKKTDDFYAVSNIETYLHEFPTSKVLSNTHLIEGEGLKEISKFISRYLEGEVTLRVVDETDREFLVPWGQISVITAMLLKELGVRKAINLELKMFDEDDNMKIQLTSDELKDHIQELSFDHYRGIRKFAKNLGIDLIRQKENIFFNLKVDYNTTSKFVGYSTFQE
jgi:hypothetical protein